MKYIFFASLLIFINNTAYALCLDAAAVIQVDIHAKSGSPSKQNAHVNQQQGDHCFGNINISTVKQVNQGFNGSEQTVNLDSHQDTPAEHNPINKHGIDLETPSIKTQIIVQHEVTAPDEFFNGVNLNK